MSNWLMSRGEWSRLGMWIWESSPCRWCLKPWDRWDRLRTEREQDRWNAWVPEALGQVCRGQQGAADCEVRRKSGWEFRSQRPSEKNSKREVTVNTEDTTERSRRVLLENWGRWRSLCYRQERFRWSGGSDSLVAAGLGAGQGEVQTVNRHLRSCKGSRDRRQHLQGHATI